MEEEIQKKSTCSFNHYN